jgi:hypothetical protein
MNAKDRTDRILPETRALAILVIPFLVAAFGILYLFPLQTERLFAWKLQPAMSAMMLGAAYAGGIYFFTGVLLAKQWHKIKTGFLPVMAFASLLGIATILHWGRFNHQHISFFAWAGLYFTTPFIVLAVWLRNRPQDPGGIERQDVAIPYPARLLLGSFGLVTLVIGLFLFIEPSLMVKLWPWTLTPLTARVMGAMFALPGLVGLGIAADPRWSAAQLILQSQGFSILLIVLASAIAGSDFNWTKPASWLFTGGLALMLLSILALYLYMQSRYRTQRQLSLDRRDPDLSYK